MAHKRITVYYRRGYGYNVTNHTQKNMYAIQQKHDGLVRQFNNLENSLNFYTNQVHREWSKKYPNETIIKDAKSEIAKIFKTYNRVIGQIERMETTYTWLQHKIF